MCSYKIMQIQVVIKKSTKPILEFVILEIPRGIATKTSTLPSPILPPAPSIAWQRGKAFHQKVSDLGDYFARNPLHCKHFPLGTVPEMAVTRITDILYFLFNFVFKLLFNGKGCKRNTSARIDPKFWGYCLHLKTHELYNFLNKRNVVSR